MIDKVLFYIIFCDPWVATQYTVLRFEIVVCKGKHLSFRIYKAPDSKFRNKTLQSCEKCILSHDNDNAKIEHCRSIISE